MIIRYSEGKDYTGDVPPDNYWMAHFHADQRLKGIPQNYKCAPVGMYDLEHFRWLGGWDCSFEHLNMTTHDLAFRCQKNGGQIYMSPNLVLKCDFNEWDKPEGEHIPLIGAYKENDLPLFQKIWGQENNRIQIDFENWKMSPSKWVRRFGEKK